MVGVSTAGTAKSHSAHILVTVTFRSYSSHETLNFHGCDYADYSSLGFKRQVPVPLHRVDGGVMYLGNVGTCIKLRGVIALPPSNLLEKGTLNEQLS